MAISFVAFNNALPLLLVIFKLQVPICFGRLYHRLRISYHMREFLSCIIFYVLFIIRLFFARKVRWPMVLFISKVRCGTCGYEFHEI